MDSYVAVIQPSEKYVAVINNELSLKPVITTEQLVVVNISGPQGPAGPPSDKNYVHDQVLPSATWTINHNLGKYPAVTFRDSGGSNIMLSYQHMSINQVVATANSAVSGSAECN